MIVLPRLGIWFDCRKHQSKFPNAPSLTFPRLLNNSVSCLCANIDNCLVTRRRVTCFYLRDDNSLRMRRGRSGGAPRIECHSAPETLEEKDPCDFPPSPNPKFKTRLHNEAEILFSAGLSWERQRETSRGVCTAVKVRGRRAKSASICAVQCRYCVKREIN